MGPVDTAIHFAPKGVTVILMAGLQGSGKTTTCGKLALMLKNKLKRKPLLVAADVRRPAAIDQLQKLGAQIDVPVFTEPGVEPPLICEHAVEAARREGRDTVVLDTAGRLHIDEEMMREVREVAQRTKPHEVYLVCDAMIGQDAVRSAREFNEQLELTGVILTKLDGDARGGAALSVKAVTGKPIKFIGVGEKLEGTLEPFRPEGMAGRVLGFGDVVSLVSRVQEHVDQEQAEALRAKLLENTFTLDDFLKQLGSVKKLGSMSDLLKMVPGMSTLVDGMDIDDGEIKRVEAVIQSMTPKERRRPEILNTMRRDRIAKGAGVERIDVDDLLKQFQGMKKMMDQMGRAGGKGPLGKIKQMGQAKKEMSDIGGMMQKMMLESAPIAAAPRRDGGGRAKRAPGAKGSVARASREDILKKRKKDRKNRRQARRKKR
jgi:signal recognition particle subunit SRP54